MAFDFRPRGFVRIFTRGLENVTHMFPDLVRAVFKEVKAQEAILDGEVIVSGPGDLIHIPRNTVHGGGRTVDEETVAFAVKSPAGSGVMGEDYNLAENADELLERVEKKWKEIMEKESTQ